nr:uncharacterized mitochondrial protein AtMg00810-like [Tanacetum cinerariifolium]
MILQESVSNEVMCTYLLSLSDLDALAELQCLYLHKVKECDCLAQKLSKQTDSVSKEAHTELLQHFAKVEKHSISLEIALQKCKEQVKNDTVWNEQASNVFRKEREEYIKIQDLKAQLQDKKITISELKKLIKKGKGKSMKTKFDKPFVVRQPNAQRFPKPSVLGKPDPFLDSLERRYFSKTKSVPKTNESEGLSKPVTAQTLPQTTRQAVSNTNVLKPEMYHIDNKTTKTRAPQSPQTVRNTNPHVSTSTGVNHKTNISRPQHRSNQLKDKVVPNNSQVKLKKTQVEEHPRIPSISHANKSVATPHKKKVASNSTTQKPKSYYRMLYEKTGLNHNLFSVGQFFDTDLEVAFQKSTCFVRDLQCNDLLTGNRGSDLYTISLQESTSSTPLCFMAKASPTQAWLWHQRLSHLNFDYINLLSKKDVVIGLPKLKYVKDHLCSFCELSKEKRSSFKSKAVPSSKRRLNLLFMDLCGPMRVASINRKKYILMKEKGDPCILVGYSTQSIGYHVYTKRTRLIFESIHICFDEIKEMSKTSVTNDTSGLVPQRKKVSDYDNSEPVPQLQNVSSSADAHVSSQQELDLLFDPLYDEFFTIGTSSNNKSSSPTNNSNQQDTQPTTNIQPTSAPSTPTYVHAKENNDNQAEEEHLQDDEFTNPFCTSVQEVAESSSHNIGNLNVPTFNQPEVSKYRWTKDHPLEQVCRNPSKPVQTRRQLVTDPKMCMFALTEEVYVAQPEGFVDPDHPEKAKYALEILHKHGMEKGQNIGTPMATKPKLDADLSGNPVDQTDYRSKIESLMYLTSSRPDIVQAGSSFGLTPFSDADHAGCIDTCKSTSGGIQFLGDKLVNWMSKKQDCTAMSSAKAEYVALSASCAQVIWKRTQLQDYGLNYNKIPLYCDSQSAIAISCNPVQHFRTKHIHTWFKYLIRRIGMICLTRVVLEVLAKESA